VNEPTWQERVANADVEAAMRERDYFEKCASLLFSYAATHSSSREVYERLQKDLLSLEEPRFRVSVNKHGPRKL
jgi:hypothetical protein